MNHEPIQFLPVNKFWEQAQRSPQWFDVWLCMVLGFFIGFAGAWVLFAIIFF